MIYHLSHLDLDGFFALFLSSKKFPKEALSLHTANYGKDLSRELKKITKKMNSSDHLIITDINLSKEDLKIIDKIKNKSVYDHHHTEVDTDKLSWYFLNKDISASKLYSMETEIFSPLLSAVNALDMWDTSSELLSMGAFLSEKINENYIFPDKKSKIDFFMEYFSYLDQFPRTKPYDLNALMKADHAFTLRFTAGEKTMKEIFSKKMVDFGLSDRIFKFVSPMGEVFFLLNDFGLDYFQYVSQELLTSNPTSMVINIRKNNRLNFRDKEGESFNLAKRFNGSGHPNAAGGSLFPAKREMIFQDQLAMIKEIL